MDKLDLNSINEIWDIQIGENQEVAQDFAGRWINKNKYQNYDSEFAWTLIDFGDDEYLVAHVDTEKEFPKDATFHPNDEFIINGKIFSINKNSHGEWDINLIEYKKVDNKDNENDEFLEENEIDEDGVENIEEDNLNDDLDSTFSFNNDNVIEDDGANDIIKNQKRKIEILEKQLEQERDKTQLLKIKNKHEYFNNVDLDSTTMFQNFSSDASDEDSFDNNLIENLTKKLNEQTIQLQSLKHNEKLNREKIREIEYDNSHFNNQIAMDQWKRQFGYSNFATDFAGKIISKDKFNLDTEGGWNIDYYNNDDSNIFIASTESIEKRNHKSKFTIDGIEYVVKHNDGKWKIEKLVMYTPEENLNNITSHILPDDEKSFNGNYEMYSSLLVNLEHFSVVYLNKFEQFLRETLNEFYLFKELFVYSNENSYKNNRSDISVYSRVFFKTSSIENDIEILKISLYLKKGMMKFMGNFWNINANNHNDKISFSMFLYHHQRHLKFINAQTNFELLKLYPVPDRIPSNKLIVDGKFNSILKFNENNMWKKLKPYSIDYNDNAYYICDIDINDFKTDFHKK
ncbi:MAG: hypothetical protein HDR43_01255 [Mycoplasma sp.]|nr:hypothetical protein [Mycoplasma sp.]